MRDRLFPTPDSIPFDVEEVHDAISKYKGYPSTKITNRHSPRLAKELKKCGWCIDDKGYIYPKGRLKLNTGLWGHRAKTTLAVSIVLSLIFSILGLAGGISFATSFKTLLPILWLGIYCITYLIDASEGRL